MTFTQASETSIDHFVRLVFPKPKPGDEQLVKEISVGSTMINEQGKSGSAGSFEIGPPSEASYFSFEPNKGALGAGNSVTVKVNPFSTKSKKMTHASQLDVGLCWIFHVY